MVDFMFYIPQALLIATALSIDGFAAAISYGVEKIKIPVFSAFILSVVSAFTLLLSSLIGSALAGVLPDNITHYISFGIMLILGLIKLFESFIKALVKKLSKENGQKKLKITLLNMTFLLQVYADCKKADKDLSRRLSAGEAFALSLALSLDSLGAGLGVGLSNFSIVWGCSLLFILTLLSIYLGAITGKALAKKAPFDISFLGGILLIILAFLRL